MEPLKVKVIDIRYNRNGLIKLHFHAWYEGYSRRGIIVYNSITEIFCSHRRDLSLIATICTALVNRTQTRNDLPAKKL